MADLDVVPRRLHYCIHGESNDKLGPAACLLNSSKRTPDSKKVLSRYSSTWRSPLTLRPNPLPLPLPLSLLAMFAFLDGRRDLLKKYNAFEI